MRDEADTRFGSFKLAVDTVAKDLDAAAALVDERADDADRRRLAGAIRSEQRIEVTNVDTEVDALECLRPVGVGLGEVLDGEGLHKAAYCTRGSGAPMALRAVAITPMRSAR